jgi:hypothetical protein
MEPTYGPNKNCTTEHNREIALPYITFFSDYTFTSLLQKEGNGNM